MAEVKLKEEERTKCEVWTRVMGYHRPIDSFNKGKKSEYYARKCFTEEKAVQKLNEEVETLLAAE